MIPVKRPFFNQAVSTAVKFGQMMKKARDSVGMSQKILAEELRISRVAINNYEQGKQAPNLSTAIQIALRLRIQLDDLVKAIDQSSLEYELNNLKHKELSKELKDAISTLGEGNEYEKS